MAIPNISSLLIERERRSLFQYSHIRAQHGVQSFNTLQIIPEDMQEGKEVDGFVFGRDMWGIGQFSEETSPLASKYGL